MAIQFNFPKNITLPNRANLKMFILFIFKNERKNAGAISYIFCSDEFILEINKSFLKHNYYTDIITFDLSEQGSSLIDADIYISIDTIRVNAKRFNTSINKELHRVIFHGILHLCGYKDKTQKDQSIMTSMENFYLNKYF